MSIRRVSCDPCFTGRRKCDLTYPICGRCQRNNKTCHYAYPPPQLPAGSTPSTVSTSVLPRSNEMNSASLVAYARQTEPEPEPEPDRADAHSQLDYGQMMVRLGELRRLTIPRPLCVLGELPTLTGPADLGWVFDQIRDCPLTFANQAQTMFIHKELFCSALPLPLRTAYGICARAISMNDHNRPVFFKVLAAEIADLLAPAPTSTLLEDLARLQAVVLYQIIRFYNGNLEQRVIAEQQEFVVRSSGLKLLQRADVELRQIQPSWETFVVAESIRRTVLVAFKLYTLYWIFRHGTCIETAAMNMLPVSTKPSSWASREAYLQYSDRDQTTTYADFFAVREGAPRGNPDNFEKLLVTGCRGLGSLNAVPSRSSLEE